MADAERPKFIKPDEPATLLGYPTPGEVTRNRVLEGQVEKDQIAAINEGIKTGKFRLGDIRGMLKEGIQRRINHHQNPTGLKK